MTNDTSNFALWRDVLSSENSVGRLKFEVQHGLI